MVMLVIVIKGAIIFTKGFINHYKIYQGQNDPIIFFCYNIITDLHLKARKIMLRKGFVFCKTKTMCLSFARQKQCVYIHIQ
jgi:hypothetical protein